MRRLSQSALFFFTLFFCCTIQLRAQTDTMKMDMHGMDMSGMDMSHMMMDEMEMTSSFSPNLPMNRDGSGTSWQPDASPMMMYMKMKGKTTFMAHGFIFIRYNVQDITKKSDRGGSKFDAPNMFMFMVDHKFNERNLLSFRSMFSLDPLTIGAEGYPLLFQTGESYKGEPLVDRQHPHDLFSELALNYTHSFSENTDLNLYAGYPGEPALGPVVFMHRLSAMNNPDAPLGHHWEDATHITFGVATLGFRYKIAKLEGSIFTGREPDENRYNFDKPRFDSYSYRLSVNPGRKLALQFSQGFIKSPEDLFPEENIIRTTASVTHTALLKNEQWISTTFVWGMNHIAGEKNLHAFLLESNLELSPLTIYGRYEFVQKDKHELNLTQFEDDPVFNIQVITIGINRHLFSFYKTDVSAGIQGSVDFTPALLKDLYGSNPLSGEIYLRIAPAAASH